MTGDQLKALREARSFTREQLAADLGDCSASTINKWERDINPVPAWVAEKMLRNVKISFPIEQLHQLLDLAREENMSFEQLLTEAIRDRIAARHSKPSALTVKPGQIAAAVDSGSNIMPMPPQHFIAAESPGKDAELTKEKRVNYRSSNGRKK